MIQSTADGLVIDIRVIPRAGRSGIAGTRQDALLVRLNAPPVDGAANEALIQLLADTLGVSRRAVTIVTGERSRSKRVRISGISLDDLRSKLGLGDI